MAKKIGKAIRDARNQNALTQEELAKKLNVSTGLVSQWETGRRTPNEPICAGRRQGPRS